MENIKLPGARLKGEMSVEEAIQRRRSRRDFAGAPLTMEQLGQVLWCAQGVTERGGSKRAAPSAGATYPMVLFAAVGEQTVAGLGAGVYQYLPAGHALKKVLEGDIRGRIASAAYRQHFLAEAPLDILMAADHSRTSSRYRGRAPRYVAMEAGHIGQNIYLQAEALGLGTVAVGAFDDGAMAEVFGLPRELEPLYLMPVGHVR
ncbi:MAG: SagB/ThcOx family dehydrogenase [Candidatus Brocadiae bacterium]|nr:SagB/ThcOx family dehydrogenase [Candidatus Brocadiia bacterium]